LLRKKLIKFLFVLCKFNSTNAYYKASARTQTQHKITQILKNALPNKQYNKNVTETEKQRYELSAGTICTGTIIPEQNGSD
jgi:hypothetical protein